MKIVCLIKTTCPFNNEIGIAPGFLAPTVRRNVWADNYYKLSEPQIKGLQHTQILLKNLVLIIQK